MQLGFVGLGNMGKPMARNLARAGHQVTVFNRTHSVAQELSREGARMANTPADAARNEIVITMLADDHAVESVTFGDKGLLSALPKGSLHISMSTISPELARRLLAAHSEHGQKFISAPVFGRPEAAAAAKLFIVVAGERDSIAKAKPVFDALGQRVFEIDQHPDHANLVKLSGNFLIMCVLESLGEVFAVAQKAGIDPKSVFEVLSGTLFGAPAYTNYGPRIIDRQFSPAGFRMPLGLKDIRLMMQAAESHSAPMPFANVIRDHFLGAIANGHGDLDWSAMTLEIQRSAGLA